MPSFADFIWLGVAVVSAVTIGVLGTALIRAWIGDIKAKKGKGKQG
jgi:hypothetical protein